MKTLDELEHAKKLLTEKLETAEQNVESIMAKCASLEKSKARQESVKKF